MTKKIIFCILILVCILVCFCVTSFASDDISLVINGEKVSCEVPPVISNDRTLVPVRVLFEYYDANVSWNASLRQVMVISGTTVMIFNIDSKIMYLNGAVHTLDAAPVIINDRTLVPVRFVSEKLGYIVNWNASTRTVSITKPNEVSSSVSVSKPSSGNETDAITLSGIKVNEKSDYCEISVELSEKVTPKVMTLKEPYRLIFDFYGTKASLADGNKKSDSEIFTETRWASHDDFTRIVVETKEECKYSLSYVSGKSCKITVSKDGSATGSNVSGNTASGNTSSGENSSSTGESKRPVINYSGTPVVVIDPGHGGHDPGAIGEDSNGNKILYEKEVCLDISTKLKNILSQNGVGVIMTRTTDVAFAEDEMNDLLARCDIANNSGACLFVSIHNNAFTNPKANGTCVLYSGLASSSDYGITSKEVAQNIQKSMVAATSLYDRGLVESPGIVVLKKTAMPAVLVECAFITSSDDQQILGTDSGRAKVANAIADGIVKSLKQMGALK